MSVFNSISNAFVALIVFIIIGSVIFGLTAAGTELANPRKSQAEANRIDVETGYQQSIYQQNERRLKAETDAYVMQTQAESDAKIAQTNSELKHRNQINAISENLYSGLAAVSQAFSAGLGIALCLCLVILTIGFAARIARPSNTNAQAKTTSSTSVSRVNTPSNKNAVSFPDYYLKAKTAEAIFNQRKWNEINTSTHEVSLRKEQTVISKHHKPITWQDLISLGND